MKKTQRTRWRYLEAGTALMWCIKTMHELQFWLALALRMSFRLKPATSVLITEY
ncbi:MULTISPECIES: hypothetical protein [unclassified Vibrio]|uniref:hypothetical protein n=1 Tax=unclassified Vibrio TaxID=2614977 RepID=UPI0020BF75B1|nr:hypothetical protein [Vibrio sp. 1CM23M]MCK8070933.1 hypothetical protein [Vibrio sp. 1CM23M]